MGRCIYCGVDRYAPDDPRPQLANEHIIPEAINGSLILPEASCRNCERAINRAEWHLLKTTLMPVRSYLEMQSKSPLRNRPKKLPIYDGSETPPRRVMVNVEDYPACLYLPALPPARGLAKIPWRPEVMFPPFCHYLQDTVKLVREKYKVHSVSPPRLGAHHLFRMLAKIAHSFAVIHFGLGKLDYVLRPLILDNEQDPLWFIGCDPLEPPIDQLHQLDLQYHELGGGLIITTRIRLFARYGAPIYRVIVGWPNAATPPIALPFSLNDIETMR